MKVKKVAIALVSSYKKLKPYFQAHQVIFFTNNPLR
jgi:hypothetical protein